MEKDPTQLISAGSLPRRCVNNVDDMQIISDARGWKEFCVLEKNGRTFPCYVSYELLWVSHEHRSVFIFPFGVTPPQNLYKFFYFLRFLILFAAAAIKGGHRTWDDLFDRCGLCYPSFGNLFMVKPSMDINRKKRKKGE